MFGLREPGGFTTVGRLTPGGYTFGSREACGFHTGQIPRDLLQQAVDILPVRGEEDMGRMVIEVPEELAELGKAMAEQLAEVQRTMARQGGGKAVDYALVEQAMWEAAGRTERGG